MVKKLAYTAAILTLAVVFALGILTGWSHGTASLSKATKILKDNELNTESFLIEQELFSNLGPAGCGLTEKRLSELSNQLYSLGKTLGTPTARKDLGEESYNLLKRRYHLLQAKTYTLYYKFKQQCTLTNPIILFYYSQHDQASADQGPILDQFVTKHDARVFAVEYNYSTELNFLEQYYNISILPTIVLNYNTTFEGLTSIEKLEKTV